MFVDCVQENLDLSADLHSKEDKLGKISDNVKKLNKLRDTLTRKVGNAHTMSWTLSMSEGMNK